jgi:hypothetical protein
VWLHRWYGGFVPGRTNEPGSSDEIEFVILLGPESDSVQLFGTESADHVRIGHTAGGFVGADHVNLNADESSGIDSDMVINFVERIEVYAGKAADDISGAGGAGTGMDYERRLVVYGGSGGDILVGGTGRDWLEGQTGGDTIKGRGGNDQLDAADGITGNDTANGGAGDDDCVADPGDTVLNC